MVLKRNQIQKLNIGMTRFLFYDYEDWCDK